MMQQNFLFLICLLTAFSCSREGASVSGAQTNTDNKAAALGPQELGVSQATSVQCAAGGSVFNVYHDQNGDGIYEPSTDILVTSQTVCNGTSGSNGHSTLTNTTRVSVGLSACASGSGLEVNFGLDSNDNGVLGASEISAPQILCDGVAGATGSAGTNGVSMVFQVVAATPAQCQAGGTNILMALDSDRSGNLSASDQNFQSTVLCNGQDGKNAQTSSYTPVEPILACGNAVAYKEVLLRLSDGQVLGSFSQDTGGTMTRLSFLPDGTYMNTDSSGCIFSLNTATDGKTRSISWQGATQETWSLQ